ncbi:hypothetical protein ACSMXN_07080 [Jatrophihabitans sp. DSM 45814]
MAIEIRVGDVSARIDLWSDKSPRSVERFIAALPSDPVQLVPSVWSGTAMEVVLPIAGDWLEPSEILGCSLYPGMVAIRQWPGEVMLSFGTAESRSAAGREYCVVVGRIREGFSELAAVLGTNVAVGALSATFHQVED